MQCVGFAAGQWWLLPIPENGLRHHSPEYETSGQYRGGGEMHCANDDQRIMHVVRAQIHWGSRGFYLPT